MQTEPALTLDEAKAVVETKTAPRVTEQSIRDKITNVDYVIRGTTTICIIEMPNGFKFIGTSTPAAAANFDPEVGKRYAYDNAFKQIWTHEGYLLRQLLWADEEYRKLRQASLDLGNEVV